LIDLKFVSHTSVVPRTKASAGLGPGCAGRHLASGVAAQAQADAVSGHEAGGEGGGHFCAGAAGVLGRHGCSLAPAVRRDATEK